MVSNSRTTEARGAAAGEDASLSQLRDGLERALSATNFSHIVPINNTSYHVLRHLIPANRSRFSVSITLPNALLYMRASDVSIALFAAELEYGRSLSGAVMSLPAALIDRLHPITLLVNNAKYAREERERGIEYLAKSGTVAGSTLSFLEKAFTKETHIAEVSSDKFHRGIGLLRRVVTKNLSGPFNSDATVFHVKLNWHSDTSRFLDQLISSGIVASVGGDSCERLSLLSPDFFDERSLKQNLKAGAIVKNLFCKLRVYVDYQRSTIAVSPMVFPNLWLSLDSAERLVEPERDQLLKTLVSTFHGSLRDDISVESRLLALYDVLGLYADTQLALSLRNRMRSNGIELELSPDSALNSHYYGSQLAELFDRAFYNHLHESSGTPISPIVTRDGSQFPDITPDPSTIALIKTAAVEHYERNNDPRLPRTCWNRKGLTFAQLRQATGLSDEALSMGIDILSDSGLTESYNLIRALDHGRFEIDRAFNSLSDEFLSALAMSIWTFSNLKKVPFKSATTSIGTMHKVMCFIYYLQGVPKCKVLNNRFGKTISVLLDEPKGDCPHLKEMVKRNSQYFVSNGQPPQLSFTREGQGRDWTTHLVNAERVHGLVSLVADCWSRLTEDLSARKSRNEMSGKLTPFELFSAFIDCIGKDSPEWGTATIAHLVEYAIIPSRKKKPEKPGWYLNDAGHKARVVEQVSPILNKLYAEIYGRLKFDPLARELLCRFAVLPQKSSLLRFIGRIVEVATREDGKTLSAERISRLLSYAELLKPFSQHDVLSRISPNPPSDFDGYVVFLDLVNMKKLSPLKLIWPESTAVQLMTSWASLYDAVACRSIVDGVIAYFGDLFDALRFAVGSYVHVEEAYGCLSRAADIETGLIGAIAKGGVEQFESLAGLETTGSTIALAATIGKVRGTLNIASDIAESRSSDFKSWGITEGLSSGSGSALLNTQAAFEVLFVKGEI